MPHRKRKTRKICERHACDKIKATVSGMIKQKEVGKNEFNG